MPPALTHITGTAYKKTSDDSTPVVATNAKLKIFKAYQDGSLLDAKPETVRSVNGEFDFYLPRNAPIDLYGNFVGFDGNATKGTRFIIPDVGEATLESLLPALNVTVNNVSRGQLATETAARQAADTALQTNITAEASARAAADVLLAPLASPTFTGTPAAPTAPAVTNTTQIATTAFVQQVVAGLAPYLVYTAKLSQAGTDAPTAVVLENTLGGAIVWTRDSAGQYTGTLAGAFPAALVWFASPSLDYSAIDLDQYHAFMNRASDNAVHLRVASLENDLSRDNFQNLCIEIRVYSA